MAAAATATFAEQRAFAAKVAKEKTAVEWAIQQVYNWTSHVGYPSSS